MDEERQPDADDQVEDLDVAGEESENVKGGIISDKATPKLARPLSATDGDGKLLGNL